LALVLTILSAGGSGQAAEGRRAGWYSRTLASRL
jgi:hypothetical protein